jgi:hypothetical protein
VPVERLRLLGVMYADDHHIMKRMAGHGTSPDGTRTRKRLILPSIWA